MYMYIYVTIKSADNVMYYAPPVVLKECALDDVYVRHVALQRNM